MTNVTSLGDATLHPEFGGLWMYPGTNFTTRGMISSPLGRAGAFPGRHGPPPGRFRIHWQSPPSRLGKVVKQKSLSAGRAQTLSWNNGLVEHTPSITSW